ncbi:hypothetical protein HAX54_017990, partial [Datura stramonium]|nr:hypothetical protein [Datura stramonium]
MESKGKEVVIAKPSLKRLRKGAKGVSSSAAKTGPSRRFGAKAVEPHIDEGRLVLEFLTIREKLRDLGVRYIFVEPEECNLTLVR